VGTTTGSEIESTIAAFMHRELGQCPAVTEPLLATGYLDSLRLVLFVAHLEERFHLVIPPDDMNDVNFRSIETVITYLRNRLR
jgi:acyl carrier protein